MKATKRQTRNPEAEIGRPISSVEECTAYADDGIVVVEIGGQEFEFDPQEAQELADQIQEAAEDAIDEDSQETEEEKEEEEESEI